MTKVEPQIADPDQLGESGDIPPNPKGLKAAVLIMGILLVVGFFVVFITIIYRVVSPGDPDVSTARKGIFGSVEVGLTKGAEILSSTVDGDRAVVQVREADGSQMLIVMDIRRGHETGRFVLKAAN